MKAQDSAATQSARHLYLKHWEHLLSKGIAVAISNTYDFNRIYLEI